MSTEVSPFGVRVVHHDSHTLLRVVGELDLATVEHLQSYLNGVIADADGPILLDLADLTFIDSTGLCAILTANAELDEQGRELRVIKASTQVHRLCELCGITDLIADDPEEPANGAMSA